MGFKLFADARLAQAHQDYDDAVKARGPEHSHPRRMMFDQQSWLLKPSFKAFCFVVLGAVVYAIFF